MEGPLIVFLIVIAAVAFDRFVSYSGDGVYDPYDPEAASRKRKKRR